MSSFFTLPSSQRKRKRTDQSKVPAAKRRARENGAESNARSKKLPMRDESISGSDSEDDGTRAGPEDLSESESGSDEGETAAERRLKLAERYLENVREEVDEIGFDARDVDRDLIAERLKEDVDESKGRRFRQIASSLSFSTATHTFFRADTQSTTSVAVKYPYIYTASKDATIMKWKLPPSVPQTPNGPIPRRKKPKMVSNLKGKARTTHTGPILSLAVSPCGTYLATGGHGRRLTIFSAADMKFLKSFLSHRDSVASVTFAPRPNPSSLNPDTAQLQLFTASLDRTLKSYSLPPPKTADPAPQIAYVETLYGHQDSIPSVAAMATDFCVSVGARDRTARYWKVVEESQLVFRGGGPAGKESEYHEGSIDVVAAIPPHHFVTGGDAGTLSLWSIYKKKPLHSIPQTHGLDPAVDTSSDDPPGREKKLAKQSPRWITALAVLPGTDVVVSGSWDGFVRAWKVSDDKRRLEPVGIVGSLSVHKTPDKGPTTNEINGTREDVDGQDTDDDAAASSRPNHIVRGVINDLSVYERFSEPSSLPPPAKSTSKKSKAKKPKKTENAARQLLDDEPSRNGETLPKRPKSVSIGIVAAVGKEHRLGRWNKYRGPGVKNGAVVLEVDFKDEAGIIADEDGEGAADGAA